MGIPSIRFLEIRPLDGSQHTAFEEVCCQLASLEPAEKASQFLRKGRGADGGVECLRTNPDGSELGWQAKYVFQWDESLASQLNESIETALRTHPRLTEYTVCVPFDLPDARSGRGKSARQKWQDWKKKWVESAKAEGRPLSIHLWGQSELIARLTGDPDRMSGRVLYWFEGYPFSNAFFRSSFDVARAALGSRYTPETNVDLPIRKDLLGLVRDFSLQQEVDRWFVRLGDAGTMAANELDHLGLADASGHVERLRTKALAATAAFGARPVAPGELYPLIEWRKAAEECESVAYAAHRWLYTTDEVNTTSRTNSDPRSTAIHYLRQLLDVVSEVLEALNSRRWELANQTAVLLTGAAGSGKSHLLADVVQHQVEQGLPALLIPSSGLDDAEPWRQILTELDRPPSEQVRHFLGALNAAAESLQTRALICIDAINERHGVRFWRHRLAAFLKAAAPFPHVVIVLSCRTTYVSHIVPAEFIGDTLYRLDHEGFADDETGAAAQKYLEGRGVVRPGAPSLLPEFNNPLFLKTCCDLLQRQGVSEFPRGMNGVSAIFKFYFDAITRAINERLGLDPHYNIVPRAIEGFVDLLASRAGGGVEKAAAIALFEGIRPSDATINNSLLSQLFAEGLLSVEPVSDGAGDLIEHVRFTFERYSDYAIASRALDRWLDVSDLKASFTPERPLGKLAFGGDNYERAGVIEALSVLLPERLGHELIDLAPANDQVTVDAFRDSLLWREQKHFSARTYELLNEIYDDDVVNDLLIAVSTEPSNEYNARFIDKSLRAQSMPERDATWSTYLARRGFADEIETLISWALASGERSVDPERAELAVTVLTWFLTTSHRTVRDKATKAIAALLATRLNLAAELLARFRDVDDPYVLERLLAACYGAALQGNNSGLTLLADMVHQVIFARIPVIVDVLARDHALCILEYAASRNALPPCLSLDSCRPPYASHWPIEYVPDELVASYVESRSSGTFTDQIVSSTVNDGDFARYKMDRRVDDWSPAPINATRLPTSADVFAAWESSFLAHANLAQRTAFKRLLTAADAVCDQPYYQSGPEMDQWEDARAGFRSVISSEEWEEFRSHAEGYIRFGRHSEWSKTQPARFDTRWARRWVCKRAHDLGWTPERFSEFERSYIDYGRTEHRIERIGKKYQWIAFRELLARMSDNLAYIGSYRGQLTPTPGRYLSARQIDMRDIDPSLLVTSTFYDGWAEWPSTWWSPVQPRLRAASIEDRVAWLDSTQDVLTGAKLVDVLEPQNGRRWLVLSAYAHWWGSGLSHGKRESQRSTWYRLRCVVISREEFQSVQKALEKRTMVDPDSFERLQLGHDFYLGEYPWHRDLSDTDALSSGGSRHSGLKSARPTTVEYRCEAGGFDHSVDQAISLELPAPWLTKALNLSMLSGKRPTFVDGAGEVLFFDPSVRQPGPSAALVDRAAFLAMLQREGLVAIWVIAGEKDVSSGAIHRQKLVGSYSHTTSFWLDGGWKNSRTHEEWYRIGRRELAKLLGASPDSDGAEDA